MNANVIDIHTRQPLTPGPRLHFDATVSEALAAARHALATALGGTRSATVAEALVEVDYWLEGLEGVV